MLPPLPKRIWQSGSAGPGPARVPRTAPQRAMVALEPSHTAVSAGHAGRLSQRATVPLQPSHAATASSHAGRLPAPQRPTVALQPSHVAVSPDHASRAAQQPSAPLPAAVQARQK